MNSRLLIFALLTGTAFAEERTYQFSEPHMGSLCTIRLVASDEQKAGDAAKAAFARVEQINQCASDYLPESELSRFNKAPDHQAIPVSDDLFALLKNSARTSELTGGAFDITCVYAVQNWRRAKRQKKLPTPEQTKHAIEMTDWRALVLDESSHTATKTKDGLMIDLGGIGKGYAANEALIVLKKLGINRAIVAASGDMAIGDPPPGKDGWDVSLRTFEKPEDEDKLIHLRLKNCGVSTSGDLHQFLELDGKRYTHIIDPKTGLGLTRRIACTVIAPTAFDADAFDTPMCILGVKRGLELIGKMPGFSARFVISDQGSMEITTSPGFPPGTH